MDSVLFLNKTPNQKSPMNIHIRHMVKRIVDEDPRCGVDGIDEMIALAIKNYICYLVEDIAEEYNEFSVDEIEEIITLVMKCLLSGVDAEKVVNETFSRMGFYC